MYIVLYKNKSDNRVLRKQLTQISTPLSCDIYNSESIINPRFILEYVGVEPNYCYVAELNRYYYIRDIILDKGGRRILMCEVDVLMSNIDEILNLNCLILRQENETLCNKYLVDNKMFANAVKEETVESFGEEFITNPATCFLLTIK